MIIASINSKNAILDITDIGKHADPLAVFASELRLA